ncbi:MAG: hypothetical protein ABI401_09305 [Candidatus Dormibacter sp.]
MRKAVEQSRLMPGENPATMEPGDILHWLTVYSELVAFKSKILTDMRRTLPNMTEEAASEVAGIDVELVERQKTRYGARLGFWEQRAREIAGIRPNPSKGAT